MDYTAEKLVAGVDTLASTRGSLQERIACAWVSQLHRLAGGPGPEGTSDEVRQGVLELHEEARARGGYEATCAAMDDEQASKHATRLVWLLYEHAAGRNMDGTDE